MKERIILLFILFTFLSSCEQTSCSYLDINNSTKHGVDIQLFYTPDLILRSGPLWIRSGHARSIWVDCAEGEVPDGSLEIARIDSIHFLFGGEFTIGFNKYSDGKSPYRNEYWTKTTTRRSGGGSYITSTFEITAEDLESWKGN